MNSAEKQRKTVERVRLKISSRKLEKGNVSCKNEEWAGQKQ